MIILEGPDNSGKTTLANSLSKYCNVPVKHSGGPGKSHEEMLDRVTDIIGDRNTPCIRDRYPVISDYIFGKILRNGNSVFNINNNLERQLDELIVLNPIIIYCRPPIERMMNLNTHQLGEHDTPEHLRGVISNQEAIINLYDEVILGRRGYDGIPHIRYDYTYTNTNRLNAIVRACIEKLKLMEKLNDKSTR